MRTKVAIAAALLVVAGSAEAQRDRATGLRDQPVHVVVDGERYVIHRQDIRQEDGVVVITVRTGPPQNSASGRGEAAPTLLDRNRSPSPH